MPVCVRDDVPPHVVPDVTGMRIDTAPKTAHQVGTPHEPTTQAHHVSWVWFVVGSTLPL